ncbi:MAG: hypothetical protein AAGD11_10890 [Planctomycetota bacterium]
MIRIFERVNLSHLIVFQSLCVVMLATGCDSGPTVVPAAGKVFYNDEPLPFGSIMFQPVRGQPATGQIQPDGSFEMSSFRKGDGATVGPQKVCINCYSSQSPREQSKPVMGERSIGQLLIPRKYTSFDSSGFSVEVSAEGNEPFEFRMTGPEIKLPK